MVLTDYLTWNDTAHQSLKGRNAWFLHLTVTNLQLNGQRAETNVGTGTFRHL